MDLNFYSLSHGPLHWEDKWPPGFKGIGFPGTSKACARGSFGLACIQEFKTEAWSMRLNIFQLTEKFIARLETNSRGLFSSQLLKGLSSQHIDTHPAYSLRKNKVALFYGKAPLVTTEYLPPLHISFDCFMREDFLMKTISLFPGIEETIRNREEWSPVVTWANMESLDILQSMIRCQHPASMHHHYFEARINDLLLNYLLASTKQQPISPPLSAYEEASIQTIRDFISDNLTQHYNIAALARKAGMNEQRFKQLFKQMSGMGPYEFLLRKRMRLARQMLLRGRSAKEVARHFGYRPSNFTNVFRQFFGYGPSDLPK